MKSDVMNCHHIITARKRSLGQGNIFTPVCHSVHRGGGHVWFGGHAWLQGGVCMVAGGHAWLPGGMHGFQEVHGCGGACTVAGGMHGCGGCVVVGGVCIGYGKIQSMSGQYASYWNAFL